MKRFFDNFLCARPRFVLYFFFIVSGNALVACQSFENSYSSQTIIDFGQLDFVRPTNGSFYQEENIEFFDTLDNSDKALLFAGFARKELDSDKMSIFLEKNLAIGIAYIDKMKKESTTPIPTNHYLWMNNDSFSEIVSAVIAPYLKNPIKRIYQKNKNIIVIIESTDCLVDPKAAILYNASKELLLCGFLSTGNKAFYIPNDILQTLILFIHDDKILDKIKESEKVENTLKRYIDRANRDIKYATDLREELRNNYIGYLKSFGCTSCYLAFNLAGMTTSIIMLCEEDKKAGLYTFFLSIFSIGAICSFGWLRFLLRE